MLKSARITSAGGSKAPGLRRPYGEVQWEGVSTRTVGGRFLTVTSIFINLSPMCKPRKITSVFIDVMLRNAFW